MNDGDEAVGRMGDQLLRRRELPELAVDDHADLVGERGGVLVVVGDEQRRQPELAQELLELAAHGRPSCAHRAPRAARRAAARRGRARAPARARPAAARRRRARVGRAFARCEIRKRSRYSSTRALPGVGDVLADVHVREERVLLEDEPDPPLVGLPEDARRPSRTRRPRRARSARTPAARGRRPRGAPRSCRLRRARRARRFPRSRALARGRTTEGGDVNSAARAATGHRP